MPFSFFRSPASRGLVNLYTGTFLSGMGWSMVFPGIAIMPSFFDVSIGAAAQVVTLYGIGRFAAMPVAGQIIDRAGSRASLIAGTILIASGAAMACIVPWFLLVLVASFVIGSGDGLWAMGREVSGVDLVKLDQRGRVLSGFHGMHSGALAIGPLIGGLLADGIGFRATFFGFAAVPGVAVLLGVFAHDARPQPQPLHGSASENSAFCLP